MSARASAMRVIRKPLLWTIVCWQSICLALTVVYPSTIQQAVTASYSARFGDIQSSYGTFERMSVYLYLLIITTLATLVSLRVYDLSGRRSWSRRAWSLVAVAWQILVLAMLIESYETGLAYKIHRLDWAIFGPPDDLYSFRNLVLPQLVAWLVCTIPASLAALWMYSRVGRKRDTENPGGI